MIQLFDDSTIYILAPANSKSGGQEALHQLYYYLGNKGFHAKIAYYEYSNKTGDPTVGEYAKYKVNYCYADEVPDLPHDVIICPEIRTGLLADFQNARRVIWWLSVGFYQSERRNNSMFRLLGYLIGFNFKKVRRILSERPRLFRFRDNSIFHVAASHYAYDFVKKHHVSKAALLIEPLGIDYLSHVISGAMPLPNGNSRRDVVLYNPVKKSKLMQRFMRRYPEYHYVALRGFSTTELIEIMLTSKVYVDFGKFSGPERLPKEAVICGCCILTGWRGAARFYNDVRIDDEFKFRNRWNVLPRIKEKLDSMLNDYDRQTCRFSEYRKMVEGLEGNFNRQIDEIFIRNSGL